ncbi:signal peptidase II [Buchnera aphidicola]|uniref:Lipoprotein signal peptidase n=1 Tax=Buchnera aphidicola str. Ua (Uroleucon ambrosiae) TaxID=1005057 RepID=G2LP24_BUCUM|nr:signal peptidase II [Buchnera aphidicola]AEO07961.1 lipoprotein signal peptidase [Buchnera aphidicola str. Ua (Uroleucon ambrosiae)]
MIKNKVHNIKKYLSITIIIFVIIIDIFSKYLITKYIQLYDTKIIFSMLNLFHIHNYGAIFSLFYNENGWQRWLLSIISCFIILRIIKIIQKLKKNEKNKIIALSLIIGGATGNLIDRIYYGFIIDFIDLHINNWHFATFNIADCSIFFGIIIFLKNYYKT